MYKTPYNFLASASVQEDIKKIEQKIKEEKANPNCDMHKIYRLEEQKLIQGLFSENYGTYNRYRCPW